MATVILGNPDAVDPATRTPLGEQVTTIHVSSEWNTLQEMVRTICHDDGHWSQHSQGNPSWVESDDPELASRIAAWFGCPIGRPAASGNG